MGALFESQATLCVRVFAQAAEGRVFHFRTKGGEREVHLVVERSDGRIVAVEVKLAETIDDAPTYATWHGWAIDSVATSSTH
ncbi:MAG: DUF4143 domain-containing protein [Actinomycetota bacterium]